MVVALGGNALLRRGEAMSAVNQRKNIAAAAGRYASHMSPTTNHHL